MYLMLLSAGCFDLYIKVPWVSFVTCFSIQKTIKKSLTVDCENEYFPQFVEGKFVTVNVVVAGNIC